MPVAVVQTGTAYNDTVQQDTDFAIPALSAISDSYFLACCFMNRDSRILDSVTIEPAGIALDAPKIPGTKLDTQGGSVFSMEWAGVNGATIPTGSGITCRVTSNTTCRKWLAWAWLSGVDQTTALRNIATNNSASSDSQSSVSVTMNEDGIAISSGYTSAPPGSPPSSNGTEFVGSPDAQGAWFLGFYKAATAPSEAMTYSWASGSYVVVQCGAEVVPSGAAPGPGGSGAPFIISSQGDVL